MDYKSTNSNESVFDKYYSQVARDGIIKSLLFSLIIGLTASIIPSIIALFMNKHAVWFVILTLVVVTSAATPILYRLYFRPTTKSIAERIDRLGLKQRLITMLELENDTSYIAYRQREDAKQKLSQFDSSRIGIVFTPTPFIIGGAALLISLTMMLISVFAVEPPIKWEAFSEPQIPVEERLPDEDKVYYTIDYVATAGGYILGDHFQVVAEGEDALPVVAVPYDGYAFVDWFDGLESADRQDRNITQDNIQIANFQPKGDGENEDESKNEPSEQPRPGDEEDDEFDPNMIIDGGVYYRDEEIFAEYINSLTQRLANGEPLPPELLMLIQLYFSSIE